MSDSHTPSSSTRSSGGDASAAGAAAPPILLCPTVELLFSEHGLDLSRLPENDSDRDRDSSCHGDEESVGIGHRHGDDDSGRHDEDDHESSSSSSRMRTAGVLETDSRTCTEQDAMVVEEEEAAAAAAVAMAVATGGLIPVDDARRTSQRLLLLGFLGLPLLWLVCALYFWPILMASGRARGSSSRGRERRGGRGGSGSTSSGNRIRGGTGGDVSSTAGSGGGVGCDSEEETGLPLAAGLGSASVEDDWEGSSLVQRVSHEGERQQQQQQAPRRRVRQQTFEEGHVGRRTEDSLRPKPRIVVDPATKTYVQWSATLAVASISLLLTWSVTFAMFGEKFLGSRTKDNLLVYNVADELSSWLAAAAAGG